MVSCNSKNTIVHKTTKYILLCNKKFLSSCVSAALQLSELPAGSRSRSSAGRRPEDHHHQKPWYVQTAAGHSGQQRCSLIPEGKCFALLQLFSFQKERKESELEKFHINTNTKQHQYKRKKNSIRTKKI